MTIDSLANSSKNIFRRCFWAVDLTFFPFSRKVRLNVVVTALENFELQVFSSIVTLREKLSCSDHTNQQTANKTQQQTVIIC